MMRTRPARFLSYSKLSLARAGGSASLLPRDSFGNRHGSSHCRLSKIHPIFVKVSRFSSCSTSQDLAIKKCVPCDSKDLRSMSEQAAHELLPQVQGWDLANDSGTLKLHRSWKVKSFTKGLEFFQVVADVAEAEGHHPDLHLVGWNNVKIDIWTHAVGGLTENDFILAAKIDSLNVEHLLRKKVSAKEGSSY